MTSLAITELNARTGPPRDDDWVAYAWMAALGFLMLLGYVALVTYGVL